jgi:hypothetical protein
MNPAHRAQLAARIAEVAGHALSTRHVVTPIEVLAGIGWLPAVQIESWRRGRVPYLERVAGANLATVNTALRLLADWARQHGLTPSETVYVTWTRDRRRLRFTKTGDSHVERAWRTHWISPALTEAKRARHIRQHTATPELAPPHPPHTTQRHQQGRVHRLRQPATWSTP